MKKRLLLKVLVLFLMINIVNVTESLVYGNDMNFENIDYSKSTNIRVIIDGNQIKFDVNPQIVNGRTLVPMRAIFEAIGLTVEWDDINKIAKGYNQNDTIIFSIDSKIATVNNAEKSLDTPASIINGRTVVPLRFLSESMGYNVVWIGDSNLILISKNSIVEWRVSGYEGDYPNKEYEKKYINGVATSETRYTGNYKDSTLKMPIAISKIETYKGYENYRNVDIFWRNNSGKTINKIIFEILIEDANGNVITDDPRQLKVYNIKTTDIGEFIGIIDSDGIGMYQLSYFNGGEDIIILFDGKLTLVNEEHYSRTVSLSQLGYKWPDDNVSGFTLHKIDIEYSDGTSESLSSNQIYNLFLEPIDLNN